MTTQAAVETDFRSGLSASFARTTLCCAPHLRFGSVPEVQDAIQEAMMRIYARFVDGVLLSRTISMPSSTQCAQRAARPSAACRACSIDDVVTAPDGGRVIRRTTAEGSDPPFPTKGFATITSRTEDALAWKQSSKQSSIVCRTAGPASRRWSSAERAGRDWRRIRSQRLCAAPLHTRLSADSAHLAEGAIRSPMPLAGILQLRLPADIGLSRYINSGPRRNRAVRGRASRCGA